MDGLEGKRWRQKDQSQAKGINEIMATGRKREEEGSTGFADE